MLIRRCGMLGLLAAVAVLAADAPTAVVDQVGDFASIDWTNGKIMAMGLGPVQEKAPPGLGKVWQRRVAMVDAQRHLAEAVAGVKVTSETTVQMYELTKDEVRTGVSALLRGFSVVEEGWLPEDNTVYFVKLALGLAPQNDGKASLSMVIQEPARGADEAAVRKEADEKAAALPAEDLEKYKAKAPTPDPKPVVPATPPPAPTPVPERKPGPYTGLVVDTRGFKIERAMSPKIVDPEVTEIWGTTQVSREFVLSTGIVGYMPTLDMALNPNLSRAGNNPLVIRAIGCQGSFKANPVITADDGKLILAENAKSKFLDQFKVVFVVD